jgi:hypothetical protein
MSNYWYCGEEDENDEYADEQMEIPYVGIFITGDGIYLVPSFDELDIKKLDDWELITIHQPTKFMEDENE